jgi:hypothetical protein
MMTRAEASRGVVERKFRDGELDNQYNEYIMKNADPEEYCICNGDTLLRAAENMYLYEEFIHFMVAKRG